VAEKDHRHQPRQAPASQAGLRGDDTVALHLVLNALDPAHPQIVPCVPVLPILGG
jgi:hypothetical protein